jgi:hypothetical protein
LTSKTLKIEINHHICAKKYEENDNYSWRTKSNLSIDQNSELWGLALFIWHMTIPVPEMWSLHPTITKDVATTMSQIEEEAILKAQ